MSYTHKMNQPNFEDKVEFLDMQDDSVRSNTTL